MQRPLICALVAMVLATVVSCGQTDPLSPPAKARPVQPTTDERPATPVDPAPIADDDDPVSPVEPVEQVAVDDELKASPVEPVSTDDEPRHREIEAKALDEVVKRTNRRPEQLKAKAKRYGDDWHVSVEIVPATPGANFFLRMSDSGDVDEFVTGK